MHYSNKNHDKNTTLRKYSTFFNLLITFDCMTHHLKSLLPTIFKQDDNWKFQLLNNWSSIVGNLGTHVRLEKIQDDMLILSVYDSCWLQELHCMAPVLLKAINKTLDHPRIKHLRFKTAGVYHKQTHKKEVKEERVYKQVTLTEREQKALATIKDEQLQQALKKFLIRCYQEK